MVLANMSSNLIYFFLFLQAVIHEPVGGGEIPFYYGSGSGTVINYGSDSAMAKS